jgi:DNA-binding transcriptional MerR regulator
MGKKAETALKTISEAAGALDMPQHVLRFWESKFSQIKPMKRAGGRRYYRPDDIDLLRGIQYFLHVQGYTIKGLQKLIRESGIRQVQDAGRDLRDGRLVAGVPETMASPEVMAGGKNQGQLELGGMSKAQKTTLSRSLKELSKLRDELRKSADG